MTCLGQKSPDDFSGEKQGMEDLKNRCCRLLNNDWDASRHGQRASLHLVYEMQSIVTLSFSRQASHFNHSKNNVGTLCNAHCEVFDS